jgi:transposase
LSTKIHALVDALGNPLAFLLTQGQAHDLLGADALLPQMAADVLLADKALMSISGSCGHWQPPANRR